MQVDKTTLSDLSIFNQEEELSVFHYLNHTHTNDGREVLRLLLANPLNDIAGITDTQLLIQQLQSLATQWPASITNGTIMVIEKFFDTIVDSYPAHPSATNSFLYQLTSRHDYSLTKYSVEHFIAFLQGMQQVVDLLQQPQSKQLTLWCNKIHFILQKPIPLMMRESKKHSLNPSTVLTYANFIKRQFKQDTFELINIYSRLDAYLSLAKACTIYRFSFPVLKESKTPYVHTNGLFHLLLQHPVHYDIELNEQKNFLFLTGANMAGKSTFIKATGIAVYLAHLGMGVPATQMELSLFDGLLSNIQVADNIIRGESYFFNEVQRIKSTIEKISDGKKWLILIDELFKGTNVQDAMKCSTTVIEGLRRMHNALFVLSTHLYEIGESLQQYPNILFRYFETSVVNDELVFSYQLKEGISNDRLGYLILRKEGVVDLLEKL